MNVTEEDKQEVRIREWLVAIVAVLGLIISIISFLRDVLSDARTQDKEEEEAQKVESSFHPYFESRQGEKVSVGRQDYYKIYLENDNENVDIISGTFGFEYIVILKITDNAQKVFFWEDMIAQPKVVYDKRFKGCFLLIREDFYDCEKQIQEICREEGLEISECCSYIFFNFQYVYAGQDEEVYYLLKLSRERYGGTIEVTEPDEYEEGFRMSL